MKIQLPIIALLATFALILLSTIAYAVGGDMGISTEPLTDDSEDYPYLIEDFGDFEVFCNDPNYWASGIHTALMEDIDLDPNLPDRRIYSNALIARDSDANTNRFEFSGTPYRGTLNGNGHVINNMTFEYSSIESPRFLGLLGKNEGTVINLGVTNFTYFTLINSELILINNIGGICGENGYLGDIINCHSKGQISGDAGLFIGGLCGENFGLITNCNSTCDIWFNAGSNIGGLCGQYYNADEVTDKSFATGSITINNWSSGIGGLIGTCMISPSYFELLNCYADVDIISNSRAVCVGGLVGNIFEQNINGAFPIYSQMKKCYSMGTINVGDNSELIGGLFGKYSTGNMPITECYTTSDISAGQDCNDIGGFCGWNTASINDCYSRGSVSVGDNCINLGGFCGKYDKGDNVNTLSYCYSAGEINLGQDTKNVGGFCGIKSDGMLLSNSYWDSEISKIPDSIGKYESDPNGIIGLTTEHMQVQLTFTDAGWDFIDIWNIGENQTYPYLRTYSPADINKDGIVNLLDFVIQAERWLEER